MLGADVSGDPSDRTAADNQTVRAVYVEIFGGWESPLPYLRQRAQGFAERHQGAGNDPVVSPLAALLAGDEPGLDELLHVVGNGRLGQADRGSEVADAGFAAIGRRDQGQQPDPVPVAQRAEDTGDPLGGRLVERTAGQGGAAHGEVVVYEGQNGAWHVSILPY
jgi:hypothetical protein